MNTQTLYFIVTQSNMLCPAVGFRLFPPVWVVLNKTAVLSYRSEPLFKKVTFLDEKICCSVGQNCSNSTRQKSTLFLLERLRNSSSTASPYQRKQPYRPSVQEGCYYVSVQHWPLVAIVIIKGAKEEVRWHNIKIKKYGGGGVDWTFTQDTAFCVTCDAKSQCWLILTYITFFSYMTFS